MFSRVHFWLFLLFFTGQAIFSSDRAMGGPDDLLPKDGTPEVTRVTPFWIDDVSYTVFYVEPMSGVTTKRNSPSRRMAKILAKKGNAFITRLESKDTKDLSEKVFEASEKNPTFGDGRTRSIYIVKGEDVNQLVATLSYSGITQEHPLFQAEALLMDLKRIIREEKAKGISDTAERDAFLAEPITNDLDIGARMRFKNGKPVPLKRLLEEKISEAKLPYKFPNGRVSIRGAGIEANDFFYRDVDYLGLWQQIQSFGVEPGGNVDFVPILFHFGEVFHAPHQVFRRKLKKDGKDAEIRIFMDHLFMLSTPVRSKYYQRLLNFPEPTQSFQLDEHLKIDFIEIPHQYYLEEVAKRTFARIGFKSLLDTQWRRWEIVKLQWQLLWGSDSIYRRFHFCDDDMESDRN